MMASTCSFFLQEQKLREACRLGLLEKIPDLLKFVGVEAADSVSLRFINYLPICIAIDFLYTVCGIRFILTDNSIHEQ